MRAVIGCAIRVHRGLGPGLLESSYQVCLAEEFFRANVSFEREVSVPVVYGETRLLHAYRVDFVVERRLVIEIKCVDRFVAAHTAQMVTYLRFLNLPHGLLINFKAALLKQGLRSVLNTRPGVGGRGE